LIGVCPDRYNVSGEPKNRALLISATALARETAAYRTEVEYMNLTRETHIHLM
jgi:hypothetical protein